MGQSITVESKAHEGFCVFTTDRSITGQDGVRFGSAEIAEAASGFPATLATRLFAADDAVDHVYVASNDVVVRRATHWDAAAIGNASATISDLFRFYDNS